MKKLVLILISIFALSLSCEAQEVKQTGKTFEVTKKKKEQTEPIATGYKITVDGVSYPIYKGVRGGYFYYDKNNKKKYVPAEVKQKLKEAGV